LPPQNKIMNYKYTKKTKLIATFKLSEEVMKELKQYSKIMKKDCQDILIKTNKDKQIIIVMCDLSFKPYTWADGVTVQDQNNSFTLCLEDKSDEHFMHYAHKTCVKLNSNAKENVIMPVIVPPIADYYCDIYKLNESTKIGLIEMRTQTHFFTFITEVIM